MYPFAPTYSIVKFNLAHKPESTRQKMDILDFLPHIIALCGVITLATLSIIDLRVWLLLDWLNLTLGILGIAFHASTNFTIFEPAQLLYGSFLGAGTLLTIRFFGNMYYKQDTLGLGDVKLLGAAGLWLGMEGVVMSMTIGAFAVMSHGIGFALTRAIKEKSKPDFHRLMIPAGPGFCVGILISCVWKFYPYLTN
jgi:prepilin signal peptidase PulO-like enzyme (type II secretory pathway)